MKRTILGAAIAAALTAASLTACGGSPDNYAACKQGILAGDSTPPAACSHLSQVQVDQIAKAAMDKGLRNVMQRAGYGPTSSPAPTGLDAQGDIAMCAARIEVDAANGDTPYSGAQAHDSRLPAPCRPLSSDQLAKALDRAVKDLGA